MFRSEHIVSAFAHRDPIVNAHLGQARQVFGLFNQNNGQAPLKNKLRIGNQRRKPNTPRNHPSGGKRTSCSVNRVRPPPAKAPDPALRKTALPGNEIACYLVTEEIHKLFSHHQTNRTGLTSAQRLGCQIMPGRT